MDFKNELIAYNNIYNEVSFLIRAEMSKSINIINIQIIKVNVRNIFKKLLIIFLKYVPYALYSNALFVHETIPIYQTFIIILEQNPHFTHTLNVFYYVFKHKCIPLMLFQLEYVFKYKVYSKVHDVTECMKRGYFRLRVVLESIHQILRHE